MPRNISVGLFCIVVLASACSHRPRRPAATERERDSVLGASALPGAAGVRGALGASDSARSRNARLDSVATQP